MCEEVPRQKAAESRKIPESGSVIPKEGVERNTLSIIRRTGAITCDPVIPKEGVESGFFVFVSNSSYHPL